jgi:hypothetical protein
MFRTVLVVVALVVCTTAADAAPTTVTRTAVQRRAVFDLVSKKTDLRALCTGGPALDVEYKRTAGDVAAAVFTGFWYTPVHVRVTCSMP